MIAAWMLYCVGIALAFVVVGHALERALHLAGRPTRWAWVVALTGSFLVPATAWLVPDAFRAVAVPVPEPIAYQPVADVDATVVGEAAVAAPAPVAPSALAPSDLDRPLAWSWAVASAALLAALSIAALRLAVQRRRWRATVVDGRRVLVSDDVGPAVAGVWAPRIVIPGWALGLAERQRELMLVHEEEHVRAGDPRLLAFGALALLLAPWNPALWWQMRRLRLAVEMDCDARVLAHGGHAPDYGELLLQVGRRRALPALSAPALGEPRSFLERRIRRMAAAMPRWRWLGAAAAIAVAGGAVAVACEAPRPVAPETRVNQLASVPAGVVSLDLVASEVRRRWPWVIDDPRELWVYFVADARDSVLEGGVTSLTQAVARKVVREMVEQGIRGATVDSIGTVAARQIIPGFDTLDVARITEFGKGARTATGQMAAGQHVVIWVRLRPARAQANTARPRQQRPDTMFRTQWGLSSRQATELVRQLFPELLRGRDEPVYVWLVFDAAGRLVDKGTAPRALSDRNLSTELGPRLIPGYEALLDRHVREYGILGFGSLAPNSPPVMWVRLGDGRVRDLSAFDEHPEMLVLPWIRDGITRHYPTLLAERSGPPVELWFVADPRKQVLRTLERPGRDAIRVGIDEIHAVFPELDESSVWGWRIAQGRGLGRLVRDNVRVIWIELREGKAIPQR